MMFESAAWGCVSGLPTAAARDCACAATGCGAGKGTVCWSKALAAVGVTGLVGLLGSDESVLPSLVFFFFSVRKPGRVGIKDVSSR
jgi:hypothetical protein